MHHFINLHSAIHRHRCGSLHSRHYLALLSLEGFPRVLGDPPRGTYLHCRKFYIHMSLKAKCMFLPFPHVAYKATLGVGFPGARDLGPPPFSALVSSSALSLHQG